MNEQGGGDRGKMAGYPFYTGNPENRSRKSGLSLPASMRDDLTDPAGYIPDPGLVQAANVSLLLSQPLLLTGEPGTGKTQVAYSLAHELGFDRPLKFETKSSTEARDLFYVYDHLGRFHAGDRNTDPVNYIHYNVLGEAILRANDEKVVKPLLPPSFTHQGKRRRSVVLIDEVDKAPRDVPNDVLNEIESMYFRVPELGNAQVEASADMQPVVIMTSNSEKALPDAFLRRCIYYDVPFPTDAELRKIVVSRLKAHLAMDSRLLSEAIEFFWTVREPGQGLRKPPATAELLNWLQTMVDRGADDASSLRDQDELLSMSEVTLFKTKEDQELAKILINQWKGGRG
jgi:MoxR-like ATPase